jgi:hypothetical protein
MIPGVGAVPSQLWVSFAPKVRKTVTTLIKSRHLNLGVALEPCDWLRDPAGKQVDPSQGLRHQSSFVTTAGPLKCAHAGVQQHH